MEGLHIYPATLTIESLTDFIKICNELEDIRCKYAKFSEKTSDEQDIARNGT